jgi:hypothetical protein
MPEPSGPAGPTERILAQFWEHARREEQRENVGNWAWGWVDMSLSGLVAWMREADHPDLEAVLLAQTLARLHAAPPPPGSEAAEPDRRH